MRSENYDACRHARLIAKAVHYGQVDKGGVDYFEHVQHVARQFNDPERRIVGYLHDVIEDSKMILPSGIYYVFGADIANAVAAISRIGRGEPYFDYIRRLMINPIAREVKIADLKHNMDRSRWPSMPDDYYLREAKALGMLEGH